MMIIRAFAIVAFSFLLVDSSSAFTTNTTSSSKFTSKLSTDKGRMPYKYSVSNATFPIPSSKQSKTFKTHPFTIGSSSKVGAPTSTVAPGPTHVSSKGSHKTRLLINNTTSSSKFTSKLSTAKGSMPYKYSVSNATFPIPSSKHLPVSSQGSTKLRKSKTLKSPAHTHVSSKGSRKTRMLMHKNAEFLLVDTSSALTNTTSSSKLASKTHKSRPFTIGSSSKDGAPTPTVPSAPTHVSSKGFRKTRLLHEEDDQTSALSLCNETSTVSIRWQVNSTSNRAPWWSSLWSSSKSSSKRSKSSSKGSSKHSSSSSNNNNRNRTRSNTGEVVIQLPKGCPSTLAPTINTTNNSNTTNSSNSSSNTSNTTNSASATNRTNSGTETNSTENKVEIVSLNGLGSTSNGYTVRSTSVMIAVALAVNTWFVVVN